MASALNVDEIVTSLAHIQISRYTCGAAMALMLYDFCLTLGDEINFVWNGSQKLSPAKLMFIWVRHGAVDSTLQLSPCGFTTCALKYCKFTIVSVALMQGISIMVGIQLLALRVLALYKNNRNVRVGLFSWLAACHITLFALVFVSMSRFVPFLMYLPFTNTCYTVPDKLIGYVYLPPIFAESGILCLQIFHHLRKSRAQGSFQTALLATLYRDGYLYFAAVMSLRLLSLFIYAFAPASLWFISNQVDFPVSTALVSRFFLQLRGAAPNPANESGMMPAGSRNSYKPHGMHATSFGLPIQPVQEESSADDTRLQPVQLKQLRLLRTTPLPQAR